MGGEHRQPAKMRLRFLRRYRFHRNLQSPANGLSNVTRGYAFFTHGVIFCAGLVLVPDKPIEPRDIRDVRRRPAILSFTDISRHAFLACHGDQMSDKPLLDRIMNLGKAHDRSFGVLQTTEPPVLKRGDMTSRETASRRSGLPSAFRMGLTTTSHHPGLLCNCRGEIPSEAASAAFPGRLHGILRGSHVLAFPK